MMLHQFNNLELGCIKHLKITRTRLRHCANPALQLKLSLKKMVKGTICPLQNLGKNLERKHTRSKRFSSVQKLQAKTEHGKYIFLHV